MTSIHTKLKELRELRERAGFPRKWLNEPDKNYGKGDDFVEANVHDDNDTICGVNEKVGKDDTGKFIAQAANHWLTLISALEKAIERLEDIGTTKIAFGPERVSSCSADEAKEALAEIAEMLGKG